MKKLISSIQSLYREIDTKKGTKLIKVNSKDPLVKAMMDDLDLDFRGVLVLTITAVNTFKDKQGFHIGISVIDYAEILGFNDIEGSILIQDMLYRLIAKGWVARQKISCDSDLFNDYSNVRYKLSNNAYRYFTSEQSSLKFSEKEVLNDEYGVILKYLQRGEFSFTGTLKEMFMDDPVLDHLPSGVALKKVIIDMSPIEMVWALYFILGKEEDLINGLSIKSFQEALEDDRDIQDFNKLVARIYSNAHNYFTIHKEKDTEVLLPGRQLLHLIKQLKEGHLS